MSFRSVTFTTQNTCWSAYIILFIRLIKSYIEIILLQHNVAPENQVRPLIVHFTYIETFFNKTFRRKPTTRKGKKILLAREPQLHEKVKNTLFIEGRKCSGDIKTAMKDLYHIKKPLCKVLSRSNDISPFEDTSSLQ